MMHNKQTIMEPIEVVVEVLVAEDSKEVEEQLEVKVNKAIELETTGVTMGATEIMSDRKEQSQLLGIMFLIAHQGKILKLAMRPSSRLLFMLEMNLVNMQI